MTAPVVAPTISVSPMRRRHLRGVLRIENQVQPRPWSHSLFLSELKHPASRAYYVARERHQVLGYAGAMLVGADAHITNVAVDPQRHRRSIATRLLLVLARRVVSEGAEAMTLEVRMSNEAAQRLYRRFGFAPAGVRRNYYTDLNEDAMVMWANDVDTFDYRQRLASIEGDLATPTILER